MADEVVIATQEVVEQNKPLDGTVAAEMDKVAPEPVKQFETVPLSTFLSLKDEMKELKREVKAAQASQKQSVMNEGVKDLADKYPDVDKEFIADLLASATTRAQQEVDKKYSPIIEKQETKEKQAQFDQAFNNLFDKAIEGNPDLPKTVDKAMVKALALTPDYRNVPLSEILVKMYGSTPQGRGTSENSARTSSDRVEDIVSFDNITSEQRKLVMDDPATRKKYFDYLDSN